jgi:hypothetical protein
LLVRRAVDQPVVNVVAAVDLSPRSKLLLEWADFGAGASPLHAYHAYDVPFTARLETYGLPASAIETYTEQARSQCNTDLAALLASVGRMGPTSHVVQHGDPAIELPRYIESVRASLVVIGRHSAEKGSASVSSVGNVCRFITGYVSADVLVV